MFNIFILILIIKSEALKSNQETNSLLAQSPTINFQSNSARNRATNCLRGDCYPETGDLLIGRTKFLHASSTCGLTQPERYCVLGTTRDPTKCFVCDSREPYESIRNANSHTIENIVSRKQGDRFNRWWQSENGKQNVYIQFDLEAEFAFTHIIMTFKTFRPAAMIIEKSSNFGRTWKTHGYFAANCAESFPEISTDMPKNLGDLYCESKYSFTVPSTKGEVVFRILPPTLIQSRDPYSTEIQNLLKITNLRINFTKIHTFGDNLLDSREELKEKYYYSMYEMVVRGSCLCYGHASRCIPVEGVQYDSDKNGMVDGQCQCQHNTMGTNCEQCLPLYNDRPWQPARSGQTNECKKCACHDHARSCHFDEQLYKDTNSASGGVCDDCLHNTIGINCEKCKENYWRDPEKSIEDPTTCKPCKCGLSGSLNDGKCDPFTNETLGLVAGRCHCKSLVEGASCDKCKNGYFNLTKENPDGCEPCSCNLIGTSGNLGCDKVTGFCTCKKNVDGRACGQCKPGYFGLSLDDPNGCKPCDCSPGGSYDATCDVVTGQCNCKPNMYGRTCERPDNGFFCPTLDHYLFEAETAIKLGVPSTDYTRPLYADRKKTWTGQGFVRAYQGSFLELNIDNIFKSGHYEIVIRYELQPPSLGWNDVRVFLEKKSDPDSSGFCAGVPKEEDSAQSIEPYSTFLVSAKPVCLEANKDFKITLMFLPSENDDKAQSKSILVDSILIIPVVDELPAVQGPDSSRLIDEFNYYACKESQINVDKDGISEECAKFICNIGVHNEYALPCDCNPTGSNSLICDWMGGSCQCKANIVGRKCDECAPSTYGFGPNGCLPCNCNSGGAKDNFCDRVTGQCDCYDKIQGKHCDECQKNFWRFPSCEPCNCNGFADSCNQTTGECINCKDSTYGFSCEYCKDGYYGNPVAGQPCKECMCPGLPSGNKFAPTCYFDNSIDGVRCSCEEGYIGHRCESCAINYYGNPLENGGSCKLCQCNGNVDINDRSSCDERTGKCEKCLYNTAGDHCDICKAGFYGNASNHDCKPCNCEPFGTEDNSALNCDLETGQCACLSNVIGRRCDACKPDNYELESGKGCSYCNCDTDGTVNNSTSCSLTGQCKCLESRGGLTCSECRDGYWGDPRRGECKQCECSLEGSLSRQCDKTNGSCLCRKGITGYSCSRCDRGTTGNIPYCTPCGECYDNWADVLNDIKNQLENLEEKASNLAVASGSTVKDFTHEYNVLLEKLQDIKKILSLNQTDRQIKSLNDILTNMEKQIQNKKDSLQNFESIRKWSVDEETRKLEIAKLNYQQYKIDVTELNRQIMDLKESNQNGAENSINRAAELSEDASRVTHTVGIRIDSELKPLINALKQRIDGSKDNFEMSDKKLDEYFKIIQGNLSNTIDTVSSLNGAVCGQITSLDQKCSALCGGAGCEGKCGTNTSSCSGLIDSYNNLLAVKQNFDEAYNKQEFTFKRVLTKLKNSSNLLNNANKDVNNLLDYANKSLTSINNKRNDINDLIEKIQSYIQNNREKPTKIDLNCDYALNKNVDLKENEFEEILNKISKLAARISTSVKIDVEAEASLTNSVQLVQNAEKANNLVSAVDVELNKTNNFFETENTKSDQVQKSFDEFQSSNNKIQAEVEYSGVHIVNITKNLNELQNSIEDLKNSINLDVQDKSNNIVAKQESLKSKVKESGVTLERTKNNLNALKTKLDDLTKSFQNLIKNKDPKNGADVLESLISLQSKIINQKNLLDQKTNKIEKLLKVYDDTKIRIDELQKTLTGLNEQAKKIKKDIQVKEKYFDSCG